jgi:hypothetical protein
MDNIKNTEDKMTTETQEEIKEEFTYLTDLKKEMEKAGKNIPLNALDISMLPKGTHVTVAYPSKSMIRNYKQSFKKK